MQAEKLKIDILGPLDKSFENELYKHSNMLAFKKGTAPFYPEDFLKYFYIVVHGRLKAYQINFENGREQTFFIYKRGDMFDAISPLNPQLNELLYEVLEDAQIMRLPLQKVQYWIENEKTFNRVFLLYTAAQMRHMQDLTTQASLYNVKDKFIDLLLQNINPDNRFKYNILNNLSNTEIASLLGTVRNVLERIIKELKDDKIIEKHKKNIKILNLEKLLEKKPKMLSK